MILLVLSLPVQLSVAVLTLLCVLKHGELACTCKKGLALSLTCKVAVIPTAFPNSSLKIEL